MKKKTAPKIRYLKLIWVALIFAVMIIFMSVLKCEMAPPAY
jgi:hypothetical protein